MDKQNLQAELNREGIDPDAYTFTEIYPNEKYCLHESGGQWIVYYSERGQKTGIEKFSTENEACTYLLNIIRSDPAVRRLQSRSDSE